MTTVAVQKTNAGEAPVVARSAGREWDPFRAMRELMRWDAFGASPWPSLAEAAFSPDFDVKETKEAFVFSADLPGVKESDLEVRIAQNRLSVSGKRESEKTEKSDTYYATERSYGSFTRSFTLPEGIDAERIRADLKQGVLTLNVPKKPEAQPKKIDITSK